MIRVYLRKLAFRYPALAAWVKPVIVPVVVRVIDLASNIAASSGEALLRMGSRSSAHDEYWLNRLHEAAAENTGKGIGRNATGSHILMLVMSDLRIDPRVEREARALAQGGYRVTIVCPSPVPDHQALPALNWGSSIDITFIRHSAWSSVLAKPGFYAHHMFAKGLEIGSENALLAVHAHDLNTSYAGFALSRLLGCHLVVDFHEWTSENVHWDSKSKENSVYEPSWKYQLQSLEARVVMMSSAAITVCDSIADAIEKELAPGRRPVVIRNIPDLAVAPTKNYPPLKVQLGLSEEKFLLLYQGGTGPLRLIEPIIEALALVPNCVLAVRGPSLDYFGESYRKIARDGGFEDRLFLLPPVPSQDVVAAARGVDAGIYSVLGVCRNFIYALPNKVFEYTAAGLPVLAANYPEVTRFVEEYGVGLTFDPEDPRSIAAVINRMSEAPEFTDRCRRNAHAALAAIDANGEWRKLVALYDALPRSTH